MNIYRNAMETLVEQEVDRQLRALPPKVASYINRLELIAYALNQLPSLYATSEQGMQHQLQRGRARYGEQVAQAVQRAIAAIRRDPLRSYAPLQEQQSPILQDVLYQLRRVLKNERLSWETLPIAVEEALTSPPPGRFASSAQPLYQSSTTPAPSLGASSYAAHHLRVNPQRALSPFPEPSGVFVPPAPPAAPPVNPSLSRPASRQAPRSAARPQPSARAIPGARRSAPPNCQPAAEPDSPPEPPSAWDSSFFR